MSRNLREEIYQFVSGLPEWQQLLSAHLLGLTISELDDQETIELALQSLLYENKLIDNQPKKLELNIPKNDEKYIDNGPSDFKLVSIHSVQNLNALRTDQKFSIALDGITVVYGENGVGKSGYSRLFNNIFYSRGDSFLIGNIFGPTKNQPTSAIFEIIDTEGVTHELKYPDNKNHPAFKHFSSFDSKSVNIHIDSQNELYVQPRELDFFENLIQMIKKISDKIDALSIKNRKENHFSQYFSEESPIKKEVMNLNSQSNMSRLNTISKFSEDDEKKIVDLEKQKNSLSLTELEKNKKRLQSIKTKIINLKSQFSLLGTYYSKEKIEFVNKAIIRYEDLKAEVARNSIEQFSDSNLKGVGSDLWQQFIKHGQELNSLHLEEHPNYPTTNDACPYCRQKLEEQAVVLIQKYSAFLESKARDNMLKAHDWGTRYVNELENLESPLFSEDEALSEWGREKQKTTLDTICENLKKIQILKNATISSIRTWDKSLLKNINLETVDWSSLESAIEKEILDLNENQIKIQLKNINDELIVLQHKRILSKLIPDITQFLGTLKHTEELDKLKKQIGRTTIITNKCTELHEKYISNKYVQLFKKECLNLEITCPDLSSVGEKGKTKRKYSIAGELPSKILSEGEQRAVALADFFTEAQISEMSGLIFDDPVNSQDYKRKIKIAHRLATEAKKRQIVVLTHDLIFLNDLVSAANDMDVKLNCHWMLKNDSEETGIIHSNTTPDIEETYSNAKIAKDMLEKAKNTPNPLESSRIIKDGLGALRASYEAFVVKVVFDGIIQRFKSRIRHADIHKVHAPKEHLYFISHKLDELSGYISAHLLVDSTTTNHTPELLGKEIKTYEEFCVKFKKEKADAFKSFETKK